MGTFTNAKIQKKWKRHDAGNDSQSSGTPPSALGAQHTNPLMLRVFIRGHVGSTSPCEWSRTGPEVARPILSALGVSHKLWGPVPAAALLSSDANSR